MFHLLRKIFGSLLVQLVLVIALGIVGGHSFDLNVLQFFLSLSLVLKSLLIFCLPIVIFSCVFTAISEMPKGALLFVLCLIVGLCCSNYFSTLVAYQASQLLLGFSSPFEVGETVSQSLQPLWTFQLPVLIKNEVALFIGLIAGILVSNRPVRFVTLSANAAAKISHLFLNRFFIPLLPLMIFGFILKLTHDGVMIGFLKQNYKMVFCMVGVLWSYLIFIYAVAAKFSFSRFVYLVKNAFPAGVSGFCTMSSVAALPLSIKAAENSSEYKEAARAIIPATVNIHLVGDSICIPLMSLFILKAFGMPLPDLSSYLIFSCFFVLSKFAVAAVPGGGILVMIPILERQFGFNQEMSALITTVYILLDPVITSANVMGNNAFSTIFSRFAKKALTLNTTTTTATITRSSYAFQK